MNKIDKLFKFNLFLFLSVALLFPQTTNINGKRGVWKNYLTVDGISSNYIYDVFVDDDNSIWLSTTSGVTHFNGSHFKNYGTESGLPASNIKDILRTSAGDIIAVSETNGAHILKDGRFTQITGLYGKTIYTSAVDRDGNLVLTTEKGVFTHEGGKFNSFIKLGSKIITAIKYFQNAEGFKREVWYGGKGMVYYDDGGLLKEYDLSNYLGDSKVTSIAATASGEAWIGTLKGLFKIKRGTITKAKDYGKLSSNVIKSLFMDKDQNLWVGTDEGLYYNNGEKITQIKSTGDSENQIEDQKVYSINITNDRKIFIRADKVLSYGKVVEVMAVITSAGFNKIALVRSPTGVFDNIDLNFIASLFSFNQPRSPPLTALSEILNFIATFLKPSISILLFIFLIIDSNLSFSTALTAISEIKNSLNSFLF